MQHNEVSGLYRKSTHAHRTDMMVQTQSIAGSGLNFTVAQKYTCFGPQLNPDSDSPIRFLF